MGELHPLPNRRDTEREAADWVARMNADHVPAEDHARLERWLRASPQHAKTYEELMATWQELRKAGPLVRAVQFGQAMQAASTPPTSARRLRAGALAAVLVTIVLGAVWHFYHHPAETRFQTAIGEQIAVTLPDGSSVNLNTNSQVEVDYSAGRRVIHLERGEAYFSVAHDSERPFWVHAGNRWVRAVGTAFNVYLEPAGVQVTVSEGTVKLVGAAGSESPPSDVSYGTLAAAITAGEQAQAQGNADVIRTLNAAELNRSLAWRQKSLYFHDEPLGNVVNELMRYTPLKIEMIDAQLREMPVGGTFQTSPEGAEALLKMLEDGFGARVRRLSAVHVTIEAAVE